MQSKAKTVDQYLNELPTDRKEAISRLRKVILKNLPKGFREVMCYGMIGWVVPHSMYPPGYHCNPDQPLPFMNLASQKNFIAVYHMGVYGSKELLNWFTKEYTRYSKSKLDMGKSCIRFKKPGDIPFDLIGELASKMTPEEWVTYYIKATKRK